MVNSVVQRHTPSNRKARACGVWCEGFAPQTPKFFWNSAAGACSGSWGQEVFKNMRTGSWGLEVWNSAAGAWCVSWGQEVFKNMRTESWGLEVWNFAAGAWSGSWGLEVGGLEGLGCYYFPATTLSSSPSADGRVIRGGGGALVVVVPPVVVGSVIFWVIFMVFLNSLFGN